MEFPKKISAVPLAKPRQPMENSGVAVKYDNLRTLAAVIGFVGVLVLLCGFLGAFLIMANSREDRMTAGSLSLAIIISSLATSLFLFVLNGLIYVAVDVEENQRRMLKAMEK